MRTAPAGRRRILGQVPDSARPGSIVNTLIDGLTLVPPGIVTTSRWRPEIVDASSEPREVDAICGVGRIQVTC